MGEHRLDLAIERIENLLKTTFRWRYRRDCPPQWDAEEWEENRRHGRLVMRSLVAALRVLRWERDTMSWREERRVAPCRPCR